MKAIINAFLSIFAATACARGLNSTYTWESKMISYAHDNGPDYVASMRNPDNTIAFLGIVIRKDYILTAAHCTFEHEVHPHYNNIMVYLASQSYPIIFMESHPYFDPAHQEFDIAVIKIFGEFDPQNIYNRFRVTEPFYFQTNNILSLKGFQNLDPCVHISRVLLVVRVIFHSRCIMNLPTIPEEHHAVCITSSNAVFHPEKTDLGGPLFENEKCVGILSRLPPDMNINGYVFTALGNNDINWYIQRAIQRTFDEEQNVRRNRWEREIQRRAAKK